MSYLVLARRYRPQKFSELVGQEHITTTLKNAILQKRTAHAYLFTGPRGVGKTSAARILAKALRCLDLQPDGEPCDKCLACQQVLENTSMDVVEIDAASNTGVDNIRNLRENVEYMASIGKYRVYIIDEVHMLSTAAFNALLKTLEEPPPHVVFIFATTELHKVLPTIQSRCQRFDFKRIPAPVMSEKLKEICALEKIKIDDASVKTLVVESEGCMRDAESLLDQAIALCGNSIEIDVLERCLSLMDRGSFMTLLNAVGDHEPGRALEICGTMSDKGVDAKVLLGRTVDFFSDLHFLAFAGTHRGSDPDLNKLADELLKKLSKDEIIRAVDLGIKTQAQMISAINTNQAYESFIVKICLNRPALLNDTTTAGTSRPAPQAAAAPAPTARASYQPNYQDRPARSEAPAAPVRAATPVASTPIASSVAAASAVATAPAAAIAPAAEGGMRPLEEYVQKQRPSWTAVLQSVLEVKLENEGVVVRAKADFAGRRLSSKDGIEVLKMAYKVKSARVDLDQAAVPVALTIDPREKFKQKQTAAREHEAVKAAIKIFEATIRDTKVLDDESPKELAAKDKGADL